ncbi:uncharacterized protein LOC131932051 [Physella acuta]|uniref:uncharacterized protein LOC131932051 n=1 Tax=Physella acuta TaxID=109671 RepID=UPI0027DB1E42|nr:uncharacterized protein LOC131932051 [Physella acuta]
MSADDLGVSTPPISDYGLISEEERAALGRVKLEEDISDETIGCSTATPLIVEAKKMKSFFGPPIPKHRDGMGAYVVPVDGKPLTILDMPTPGPADYHGDYAVVLKKFPVFSLGEKPPEPKKKKGVPGPNRYNTTGDLAWGKCKRITLKSRHPPLKIKDPSPGPARYALNRDICTGPKFTAMLRPANPNRITGLMSKLVFIPDPTNPGPDYCPPSEDWLKKPRTMGIKPKDLSAKKKAPGPQTYKVPPIVSGPKWRIGIPIKKIQKTADTPGPGDYNHKSSIGQAPKYPFGTALPTVVNKFVTPGPDMYNRAGFKLDEPGYTMKYRWFDTNSKPHPGPATYKCNEKWVKKRNPAYTIQDRTAPTYPSSLYALTLNDGPGPAYNPRVNALCCEHSMGPSVSSRHTPAKYLGMKNNAVIPNPPKGFPAAPLLG